MLVGEAGDAQSVGFGAHGDVGPVNVHGDVGVADLLERRVEQAMLRADLQRFAELAAWITIVDRDDKTALQIRHDGVDPIKRGLVRLCFGVVGAFDNNEVVDLTETFPHFDELKCEELTKKWPNADVREIITAPTNRRPAARIIAVLGMIKGLLHKPGEGDRAVRADSIADELSQLWVQPENVQRRTPNVQ